jgi:hypothetical protein
VIAQITEVGLVNKKEFQKYLDRDKVCAHCGTDGDTLIPQHRANRGFGGSRSLDRPSNIIVLCSEANFLLESNASFAEVGRELGWKLRRDQVPEFTPVFLADGFWLLDNNFNKTAVPENHAEYN